MNPVKFRVRKRNPDSTFRAFVARLVGFHPQYGWHRVFQPLQFSRCRSFFGSRFRENHFTLSFESKVTEPGIYELRSISTSGKRTSVYRWVQREGKRLRVVKISLKEVRRLITELVQGINRVLVRIQGVFPRLPRLRKVEKALQRLDAFSFLWKLWKEKHEEFYERNRLLPEFQERCAVQFWEEANHYLAGIFVPEQKQIFETIRRNNCFKIGG